MIKPRAIQSGDRLAVVAPSSAFKREEFDEGIAELLRLGFEPVYDDSLFERARYLAGPAATRAAAIQKAWTDPTIAGVVCVRGGYGSAQVLPLLDAAAARKAAKPFVGYSDVTAVLTYLTLHAGLVAFHGPMLAGRLALGSDGYDRASFEHALCRPAPMGDLVPDGLETVRPGDARGPIFGGTMTQLLASFGTPYAFAPPAGSLLFLDEVAERPYRLDRMLTQLKQAGLLAQAAGVIVGELPECDEGEIRGRQVVADLLADFHGPVVIGFPSGHTNGPAMTIPLGVASRIVADRRPRVVIEESAVVPRSG
jgi:muramoyltetrapeptide carboxypeptidase